MNANMQAMAKKIRLATERAQLRINIEVSCAELIRLQAERSPEADVVALQVGAMEVYSNALALRIAAMEAK